MKCLEKEGNVIRMSDHMARELTEKGWTYCPKWKWKALFDPERAEKAKGESS